MKKLGRCRRSIPEYEPDQALLAELRRLSQVHHRQGRGLRPLPPVLPSLPISMPKRMVPALGRPERFVNDRPQLTGRLVDYLCR